MDPANVNLAEVDLAKEDKVKAELAKWIWPKRTKSKLEDTCAPLFPRGGLWLILSAPRMSCGREFTDWSMTSPDRRKSRSTNLA